MDITARECANQQECYSYILEMLEKILEETEDETAVLANTSSLLMLQLADLNWAGFYRLREEGLVVGPFQGKPAVAHIPLGKGVCGTAAAEGKTQLVEDVHACENHIACDVNSRSEIVVPIRKNGALWGVLDMDSPVKGRFDEEDRKGLEMVAERLGRFLEGRNDLLTMATQVVELLKSRGWHISFAESCTGGRAAGQLVDVPSASQVFDGSFVTYANESKMDLLGVKPDTIGNFGVVSEEAAREMASGCAERMGAQVGVSITGIAGPTGGNARKPVGMVCFGFEVDGVMTTATCQFGNIGREQVRRASIVFAYRKLLELLQEG